MDKIKREYSYRTTDGMLYSGRNAAKKALEHQKRVDFRTTLKSLIPEAHKIFKIEDAYDTDDGDTDEDLLLQRIYDIIYIECEDFKDFIKMFTDLYIEIPEMVEFLQLIDQQFKKFK